MWEKDKNRVTNVKCERCNELVIFHSTWGCGANVECPLCGWTDVITPGEPNYPKEFVLEYGVDCGECEKGNECSLNIRVS
jgi:hypothetical protein